MALRKAHGQEKDALVHVEVLPADEQPQPVPVDLAKLPAPVARRDNGQFADPAAAKRVGARGGLAKANKRRMLQSVGLVKLTVADKFHDYWRAAVDWTSASQQELAVACAGYLGPGAQAMVGGAGALLAGSRYYSDLAMKTDDERLRLEYFKAAGRLMDQQRQAMLTAQEYGNRMAKAAKDAPLEDPFATIMALAAPTSPNDD